SFRASWKTWPRREPRSWRRRCRRWRSRCSLRAGERGSLCFGGRLRRRQDGRGRDAGGGEAAHDIANVGAEDFDQFEDGGETRNVAAVLEDADVGRRDTGSLRQFLARPAALLAQ